jgi:hypothetical protein
MPVSSVVECEFASIGKRIKCVPENAVILLISEDEGYVRMATDRLLRRKTSDEMRDRACCASDGIGVFLFGD